VLSDARQPGVQVERLGILVGLEVADDVESAAVEYSGRTTLLDAPERALQLSFEVFERRHLSELVSLVLQETVWLGHELM
jgi:hypothetical protein